MTDDDRPAFAKVMARLNIAYEKSASTVRAEMYFDDLKAAPIELIERAAERWRRENKKFPRSSDLRDLCDAIAAAEFYKTPRLSAGPPPDPEIGPTYHCLACEDGGWRWHIDNGAPFERASEAFAARRAKPGSCLSVSPCPCRQANPVIASRYTETSHSFFPKGTPYAR